MNPAPRAPAFPSCMRRLLPVLLLAALILACGAWFLLTTNPTSFAQLPADDITALPLLFVLHGNSTEIPAAKNGAAVHPATAPAGLKGAVTIVGSGQVHFAPENGVWFTGIEQQ